jgi:hypothetical protein
MALTHAGVHVLLAAIGTMLLSAAFSQTDSGFYYPLNAAPTQYAIEGLPYSAQMTRTQAQALADGSQHTHTQTLPSRTGFAGRARTDIPCAGCALTEERTQPYSGMINDPVAHRVIHLYPLKKVVWVFCRSHGCLPVCGRPHRSIFRADQRRGQTRITRDIATADHRRLVRYGTSLEALHPSYYWGQRSGHCRRYRTLVFTSTENSASCQDC